MSKLGDAYLWIGHDVLLLVGGYLLCWARLRRRKVRRCARCGTATPVHECAMRRA